SGFTVSPAPAEWRQPFAVRATPLAVPGEQCEDPVRGLERRARCQQRILGNAQSSDEKLGPLRTLSETSRAAAHQKRRIMRQQPKAQTLAPLAGNRGFESTSLQQRVSNEPCDRGRPQA